MAYTLDQLVQAWTSVHDGVGPDTATQARLQYFVNLSEHQPSDAAAMSFIVNSVDGSTALAALSYQFFTGKAPTKAGLDYLVNSPDNPSDLNDGYYSGFNLENRYINFAANLGVQGEGAASFANKYGGLSFADYVASIYQTIIGSAYANAAGIDPAKAIADIVARKDALLASAGVTPNMTAAQIDLTLKAATAGYLLGEAIKADVGAYASAANTFITAVATGTATYGADLVTTYAQPAGVLGSGGGSAVSPGFNFPAPPPPVDTTPPTPPTPPPSVSHAFVLTTGTDTFIGASLSDTFTAILGTGATLNAGDTLNGGGGDDTLSISFAGNGGSFTMSTASVSNIEHLRVTGAGSGLFTLNLAGVTGVTELVSDGLSRKVTFSNIAANAKMAIANINGAAFTATFTYAAGALAGNADVADLTLTNVTGPLPVKISPATGATNEFETMAITSNGTANSIVLTTDGTQTSLTRLNVSGAAPLTLAFSAADSAAATLTTIDAHAATGGITIGGVTTPLSAATHAITLGTGHNLVYLAGGLTAADTVTAAAGNDDTLALGASVTSANLAHVTGVETFRFMNQSGVLTQDVAQLPYGVNLEVDGGNTVIQLNNLDNDSVVVGLGAFNLKMALAADTGSDALTLQIQGNGTVTTLGDVAGLETLNIRSLGGPYTPNTITTDNVTAKHVVTGGQNLTITKVLATHDFDAHAFQGDLTITLGTGADTVTSGVGSDTIYVLPIYAPPTHTSNGGGDTITTGAGTDLIVFTDNAAAGNGAATTYANTPRITDFALGADRLGFGALSEFFQLAPNNGAGGAVSGLAYGSQGPNIFSHGGVTLGVQALSAGDGAAAATSDVSFVKLTTSAHLTSDIKHVFIDAIGGSSITGLAANGNYVVSAYDNVSHQMLLAIVNVGGNADNDTTLSAADFVNADVALIGVIDMGDTDYSSFGSADTVVRTV